MLHKLIRGAAIVVVVIGLSACTGGKSDDRVFDNVVAVTQQAPCLEIEFVGDNPLNPDSAILHCEDGDRVAIPGPFLQGESRGSYQMIGGEREYGPEGPLYLKSEKGDHYVWYYAVQSDGGLNVFYDDRLLTRKENGVEQDQGKMTGRSFDNDKSHAIGWK